MKGFDFLKINKTVTGYTYKKRLRTVISILSCFVFFCTAYLLMLPAKTMESSDESLPENSPVNYTADGGAMLTEIRSKQVTTDLPTNINVAADWSQLPSGNITVSLYKDGRFTGKNLTLDSTNNWKGTFSDLEAGNYYIQYTVIEGYEYSSKCEIGENYEFVQTNALESGNTYLLVHGNTVKKAVQNGTGNTLTNCDIKVDKTTVGEAPDTAQWYYNGVSLQNAATDEYLKLNTGSAGTDSAVQNRIVYENGHIKRTDTSRYLRWYNNAYTSTSLGSYATAFTLYAKSNESASVDFKIYGEKSGDGQNTSSTPSFEHNKTIDYLGDGIKNPDTELAGPDYYRLYLDMTGKQEAVDLLIVVDGSGSMSKIDVDNMRRDAAITKFLNGSMVSSNSDGFLSYFLNLNGDNKVSVVQFYGKSADRDSHYISNSALDYTYDSSVLLDWTSKNKFVNCANQNNSGTNYEAGLKRATNQFLKVSGDDSKKIMIFLSDGVPTYFQIDSNDIGTVCNGYTIKNSDVGKRWGTGSYTNSSNYPYCKNPSEKAFDDFMSDVSNVTVFTIGVSADISETSQSESQSPVVLKYMAEHGNGAFLSVIGSMDELKLQMQSIFYPKGVVITDNMSKYVRYYGEKPDVLVTLKDNTTGTVTTLYRDGKLTSAASGILTDVVYTQGDSGEVPDGSTGKISAIFDDGYQFQPEYTVTLSFNVKTTQTAYNEYGLGGYNAIGDTNTDYAANSTSSERAGFYSNKSATVSYNVSGNMLKEYYRKPVVQVLPPKSDSFYTLTVTKTVFGTETSEAFPFELAVYGSDGNEFDLSGKILPDGVKLKDETVNVLVFSLADKERITLDGIIPKRAKLTLTEVRHDGYTVTMSIGDLGNLDGESQSFGISGDITVDVVNTAGVRLPETGSAGNLLFTSGGLLIIAGACVYGYIQKRSRERRID